MYKSGLNFEATVKIKFEFKFGDLYVYIFLRNSVFICIHAVFKIVIKI